MLGYIRALTHRVLQKHKQVGTLGVIILIAKRLLRKNLATAYNVLRFYDFILPRPFGEVFDPAHSSRTSINWVIPDFSIGSGGHLNIFRMIANLEKQGFTCRIIIVEGSHYLTAADAKADICKHFFPLQAEVTIGRHTMQPAAISVATSWETAYAVRDFQGSGKKCYFVQDFEPFFFAVGSSYAFAEDTYRFGFHGITAGKWLAEKLSQDYGMTCDWFGFSYDKDLYKPLPRKDATPKIFFYARPVTPRRAFELGLLVLNEVAKQRPDVEFLLAGWDTQQYVIPFKHKGLGVLSLEELPQVYSECDAALVLSFTNLSLLPLELMACGCAVVSNTGPNVEWALNHDNCILAEANVSSLAASILKVLNDKALHKRITETALAEVQHTDWAKEAEKVANVFRKLTS